MLDTASLAGRRAADRLVDELIIWLTTVSPDGQPQSSPVWFLWQDGEVIVYSKVGTPRLRNLARNAHVALNLDGDGEGGNIMTIEGEATVTTDPPVTVDPAFLAKYRRKLAEYGWTPARFARDYPALVRIRPTRSRVG